MAGRIRSFKPELLDLEPAAALSSDAWRVWVSMMLLADDLGNLRAAPKLLAAHIFHDTGRVATIEDALDELTRMPDICRVVLYRFGGELFAHLNGFIEGDCKAIKQFPSKLSKETEGRVPAIGKPGAEPVSTVPRTYDSSRNRAEPKRTRKNQSLPKSSGQFREEPRARAHSHYPYPYHDPDHKDLPHEVVAAPPSFAREPGDDDLWGHTDKNQETHPEPPTARSVPAPERVTTAVSQNLAAIASVVPPATIDAPAPKILPLKTNVVPFTIVRDRPQVHRPKFEPQRFPDGKNIIDPRTGDVLVLDLNALTPEQVQAERERCIAAMEQAKPPSAPKPSPPPPTPRPAPAAAPQPTVATPEDPEAAMREMLAKAPKPICLLAERSASRLASVLVGTSTRVTDIPPALQAAAMKLDPKFLGLTAESPGHDLEELHRFVAGFVGRAHMYRGKSPTPAAAPPSDVGARFLATFGEAYRKRFGRDYVQAEDDQQHAEAVVGSLGTLLKCEMAEKPDTDLGKARKRLLSRVCDQWFSDPFGERCGHAMRHLARLLRDEPNRFRSAPEQAAYGASSMPPELPQAKTIISRVGNAPTTKEHHAETSNKKALG